MFVIRYWSEGKKKPQLIDLYMNYGFDFKLSAVRTGLKTPYLACFSFIVKIANSRN